MPWYKDRNQNIQWLPSNMQAPPDYKAIQGNYQGPSDPSSPSIYSGNLAKFLSNQQQAAPQVSASSITPAPSYSPATASQAPAQAPQALQSPQAGPQVAQAPANPNDPTAALQALQAYRQSIPSIGDEAVPIDALIGKLQQGIAAGADPNAISASANAALGALQSWKEGDSVKVLQGAITGDTRRGNLLQGIQAASDQAALPLQAATEKKNITDTAEQQAKESEALRQQVLGQIPGLQKQMGEDLLNQQNYAYSKIAPQIEQRLNAMGILQSGALPEAQTRAFADLENARQGRLADFGTSAAQNLNLNMPFANLYNTQQQKLGALQSGIDLSRAGITRQFQTEDLGKAYEMQNNLSLQALQEARAARDANNKTALWSAGIGAAGQLAGAGSAALMKFSDSRLKTDIEVLDRVGRLDIVKWEWNETAKAMGAPDTENVGVIAQDVEKAYPEAVNTIGDYKLVDYSLLPNTVIEAIKWHGNFQLQKITPLC